MQVRIDVEGTEPYRSELRRLRKAGTDLRPVLEDIASALEASTQQRFLDQVGPDGVTWEKHSEATEDKRGVRAEKLRDEQHLFDSLGSDADNDEAIVGANRIYARIHQLGGQAGRGRKVKIPERPYLGLSRDDENEIRGLIYDHIVEAGL